MTSGQAEGCGMVVVEVSMPEKQVPARIEVKDYAKKTVIADRSNLK